MIDALGLKEMAQSRLNAKEVDTLRTVYHGLVDPVFVKVQGIKDQNDPQVIAARRIMYFVATVVEAARDGLLQAAVAEDVVTISGIQNIATLVPFLPQEDPRYERLTLHLLSVRIDPEKTPMDMRNALGLNIEGGMGTVDGDIRNRVFNHAQLTENGAIYMDQDAYPDAPTAPFTRPPYMSLG